MRIASRRLLSGIAVIDSRFAFLAWNIAHFNDFFPCTRIIPSILWLDIFDAITGGIMELLCVRVDYIVANT